MCDYLASQGAKLPEGVLHDAISLNHALVSQPFVDTDITVRSSFNVVAFCDGVRSGIPKPLVKESSSLHIHRRRAHYKTLEDWCREVVWWGNKKGAYLYTNQTLDVEPQLAGHF